MFLFELGRPKLYFRLIHFYHAKNLKVAGEWLSTFKITTFSVIEGTQ